MRYGNPLSRPLAVAACVMLSAVSAAPSQVANRVPVTIVLVDQMPVPNAPFVIQRRPQVSPADVILLPRTGANPRMLSDAVRALVLARQNSGDRPRTPMTLRMRLPSETGAESRGVLGWTVRVLQDLRHASPLEIAGIGQVPAVQIWLPRQDK
jgi:hypothetical protein